MIGQCIRVGERELQPALHRRAVLGGGECLPGLTPRAVGGELAELGDGRGLRSEQAVFDGLWRYQRSQSSVQVLAQRGALRPPVRRGLPQLSLAGGPPRDRRRWRSPPRALPRRWLRFRPAARRVAVRGRSRRADARSERRPRSGAAAPGTRRARSLPRLTRRRRAFPPYHGGIRLLVYRIQA